MALSRKYFDVFILINSIVAFLSSLAISSTDSSSNCRDLKSCKTCDFPLELPSLSVDSSLSPRWDQQGNSFRSFPPILDRQQQQQWSGKEAASGTDLPNYRLLYYAPLIAGRTAGISKENYRFLNVFRFI